MSVSMLEMQGAPPVRAERFVDLYIRRFFSGWVTNRSPFEQGDSREETYFLRGKPDVLIDGQNIELSSSGLLQRRPGFSSWSTATLPAPAQSIFSFRNLSGTPIVLAATPTNVYEVTTTAVTSIYAKQAGAGQSNFLAVGAQLFISDGKANTRYDNAKGQTFNDGITAPTTAPTLSFATAGPSRQASTAYGFGQWIVDTNGNAQRCIVAGTTTAAAPTWPANIGNTVTDGTVTWINLGTKGGAWQPNTSYPIGARITDPNHNVQKLISSTVWQPSTVYMLGQVIVDPTGRAQQVTQAGTSGSVSPSWSDAYGTTVTDGTVVWTCKGAADGSSYAWIADWTTAINVSTFIDLRGNLQVCTVAGTTGATAPNFSATVGGTTTDNTVIWTCEGPPASSANLKSGSSQPAWSLGSGQETADGNIIWTNQGADTNAAVFEQTGCSYLYCYVDSSTGHYSTASPASANTGVVANEKISLSGDNSTDAQVDKVAIFRTADGGSTWLQITTIANNTAGGQWNWTDTNLDSALNVAIPAPIDHANDPAPVFTVQAYYAGRRWGAAGNFLYHSGGPSAITGNGDQAFPPLNYFELNSAIQKLIATPNALLVFTTSALFVIQGVSTTTFTLSLYTDGVGVCSPNAVTVKDGNIFLFTTDRRFLALVSRSFVDLGLPVADKLAAVDPTKAYVTAHAYGSNDKAIYISDGSSTIYRCNPSQPPEKSIAWSTPYLIGGGIGAIASVETSAGVMQLLGTAATGVNVPLLYRNTSSFTDNGTAYAANCTFGSLVLSAPGQLSEIEALVLESSTAGTAPTLGVLLDEISGTFTNLTTSVNDPPGLSASASLRSLRFYLSQAQIPTLARHLQVQVSFIAENAASTIYGLGLRGANSSI